jgi:hypothetical protein
VQLAFLPWHSIRLASESVSKAPYLPSACAARSTSSWCSGLSSPRSVTGEGMARRRPTHRQIDVFWRTAAGGSATTYCEVAVAMLLFYSGTLVHGNRPLWLTRANEGRRRRAIGAGRTSGSCHPGTPEPVLPGNRA